MKTAVLLIALAALAGTALAKLPAPVLSDEAKAKAAEAAARTAWSGKVDGYKLCKTMDEVASKYFSQAKQGGKEVKPPVATPPCTDPGPFAFAPPAAQPLEAAGAHSPPATAASPPSTATPAAAMPAKK